MNNNDLYNEYNNNQSNNINNNIYSNYNNQNNNITNNNEEKPYYIMSNEELKNKKRVNKVFLGFFYTFIVIIGLVVVYMYNLDRNEFYLKEDKVIINKGSSYQIKLTPKNENIFDYLNYIYETEDKSIATVDQFGTVKAVGTGETKLNIRYKYGLENKTMLIKTENVEINSIAIKPETEDGNNEQINIRENENTQVSSEIVGREEVHISVEYRSSDEDVATIDEYGHVEGIEEGTATIIGETEDGVIGEIPVEIEEEKPSIESIEFSEKQITIKRGSVSNLTIIKTPINAEEERITYKSDNGNVVVDENGKITGINVGTSTITATSESGKQAFCVVQVIEETKPIENIYLNSTNEEIKVGKSIQLVTTISPSDATEREVVWESSNSNIATVEQNGLVIGKSEGQVVITVKSKDGRVQATCNVKVIPNKIYINTISIQEGNQQLVKGSKIRLTPIITPNNATEKVLTWSSSNPSIATVDVTGTVTTKGVGKTTITVKTVNGKETTIEIEVIEEPEEIIEVQKITLDKKNVTLEKNKSFQLTATISPSNATDKNIEWSSSNTKIATVDKTGMVTIAATAGNNKTVTITAKTSNGKTATCKITVYKLTNNYNSKDQKQYEILTRCNGKNSGAATTCGTQTSTTNSSDVRIHFINVGKGDATLLEINGKYGMIDVGSAKKTTVDGAGNPTVESTTYIEGVLGTTKKLSFIIATHNHGDHEGMMPQIVEKFADKNTKYYYRQSPVSAANIKINNNTSMDVSNSSDTYEEGIENEKEEAAEEQDEISDSSKSTNFVRKTYCNSITSIYNCSGKKYNNLIEVTNKNGTSFTIDDVEIQLLSVEEAFLDESSCIVKYNDGSEEKIEHEYSYQECNELSGKTINNKKVSSAEYYSDTENRNSLGALITYTNSSGNKIRTIITGDMYEGDEGRVVQELQNLGVNKIDIHKYGHHGTWQAGTLEYLSYIKPTYSIISTSDNSIHGRATNPGNYCYMQRNFGTKIYSTSEMKTTNEIVTSIDQRNYLVEGAIVFDLKKVGQNNYEPDVYKVKKNSNGKITGIEKDSVLKNKIKIEVNNDKTCSKTTYTGFMKNLNYGIQGATYYINSSGDFYKGTLNLGDDTYHFENNRAFMRINFFYRPRNIRYYFGSDGKMVKNKCLNISGVVHCFNASGQLKCSDKVTQYCVNE